MGPLILVGAADTGRDGVAALTGSTVGLDIKSSTILSIASALLFNSLAIPVYDFSPACSGQAEDSSVAAILIPKV